MRWHTAGEWVVVISAGAGWGWFAHATALALFPHSLLGYIAVALPASMAGGWLIGWAGAKLTWPRRRRELLKEWGIEDREP